VLAVRVALDFGQMPTLDSARLKAEKERGERLLEAVLSDEPRAHPRSTIETTTARTRKRHGKRHRDVISRN
jgi:hypothetical protein